MGESIAEGTVVKWLKKPGDKVERDEPLLEISTDKVDAEIPAPAAGTLSEILAQEGQTVSVNSVIARISVEGEAAAPAPAPAPAATPAQAPPAAAPAPKPEPAPQAAAPAPPPPTEQPSDQATEEPVSDLDERRRTKSSPLVRKIAKENDVDISQIKGSGVSGRVTKNDILDFIQQPARVEPAAAPAPAERPARTPVATPFKPGESTRIEPLSVMRKKIAQHMVISKQTSAHVTTVFEVDFTQIDKLRRQHKESYSERGVKLTYLPFIVQAVLIGLREFPVLNASMDENNILYHRDLNIGIAVALDWGLIVPVLKQADEKNTLG
ncbi:MAG: dihydrolipoamide acetyltransferase family protein, partial [bacterium]